MSVYSTYLSTLEEAYLTMVNTYVLKKQIDAKDICEYTAKVRVVAIFLDIFPYLADCDCITEEEFKQYQNLVIKITGATELGIITLDDMNCGGITNTNIRSTESGGTVVPSAINIERGRINLTKDTPYNVIFSQSLGSSASDWTFTWGTVPNDLQPIFTNMTKDGFTVETIEDCIFTYIAIPL